MKPIDYVRVALGNIVRQKLRSSLTIFAVVIGATSVTVMLALVTGAKGFVQTQFEKSGALQQVLVTQATDLDYDHARFGGKTDNTGVKLTDDIVSKVSAFPHVTGATPIADVHAFDSLSYNGKKLTVEQAVGYTPNGVIKHTLVAGRELAPGDGNNVITLTPNYADKLGFKGNYNGLVGQTVSLQTNNFYTGDGATITPPPQGGPGQPSNNGPQNQTPTTFQTKVVGVVTSDNEDTAVYVSLDWAKKLNINQHYEMEPFKPGGPGVPQAPSKMHLVSDSDLERNGYRSITVKADSTSSVEAVAKQIRTLGVGAVTAKTYVASQLSIFNIVGLVLGGVGAIALFVASIGVINTMVMAILERTREIGVMRACGAKRKTIRRLFTFEAGLLGFWGGVFGLAIGYGLTLILNDVINKQLKLNSISAANIVSIPLWLMLAVVGATSLIGVLAGLYPASRAARLNPVEALRYE